MRISAQLRISHPLLWKLWWTRVETISHSERAALRGAVALEPFEVRGTQTALIRSPLSCTKRRSHKEAAIKGSCCTRTAAKETAQAAKKGQLNLHKRTALIRSPEKEFGYFARNFLQYLILI